MEMQEEPENYKEIYFVKSLAKKYSEVPEVLKSIQMYTNISENYLEVPQNITKCT